MSIQVDYAIVKAFFLLVLFFFTISPIVYYQKKLSKDYPLDISMIWYFYFLSFTIGLISIVFAVNHGWIDEKGNSHGYGSIFIKVIMFFLNIKEDIAIEPSEQSHFYGSVLKVGCF